jgi:hypothetical protein
MSQEHDFKKLQQRTYQSYHQDGLIDIIIGLGFIGFGLMMAFDSSVFIFMSWMPIIFYVPFKNRITVPRIGYVKFTTSNLRLALALATGLLVMLFVVGLYLFVASDNISFQVREWIGQYLWLGGLVAVCFLGAAMLTGITRFYAYAGLILLIFSVGTWLAIQPAVYIITSGLLIEITGVWLLVRFLINYPLTSGESTHESQ